MTPLRTILKAWDGSSVGELRELASEWALAPAFGAQLVRLVPDTDVQVAATWLLKQYVERQEARTDPAVQALYYELDAIVATEARLHVLQVMPHVPIPADAASDVERFLHDCLVHENTFVRAWSYTGWNELARTFPDYRPQVDAMLQEGLTHGKASVKARIRNLRSGQP